MKPQKSAMEKRREVERLLLLGWRRKDISAHVGIATKSVSSIAYDMRMDGRLEKKTLRREDENWYWPRELRYFKGDDFFLKIVPPGAFKDVVLSRPELTSAMPQRPVNMTTAGVARYG